MRAYNSVCFKHEESHERLAPAQCRQASQRQEAPWPAPRQVIGSRRQALCETRNRQGQCRTARHKKPVYHGRRSTDFLPTRTSWLQLFCCRSLIPAQRPWQISIHSPPRNAAEALINAYLHLWKEHRNALLLTGNFDGAVFPYIRTQHDAFNSKLHKVLQVIESGGLLRNNSADLTLEVLAKTAIPLLHIYKDREELESA